MFACAGSKHSEKKCFPQFVLYKIKCLYYAYECVCMCLCMYMYSERQLPFHLRKGDHYPILVNGDSCG